VVAGGLGEREKQVRVGATSTSWWLALLICRRQQHSHLMVLSAVVDGVAARCRWVGGGGRN
jgi:hypothetical protein